MTKRSDPVALILAMSLLFVACTSGERPSTSLAEEGVVDERALIALRTNKAALLSSIAPRVEAVCLLRGYEADEGEWTTTWAEDLQQYCAFCSALEPQGTFAYVEATFFVHSGGRISHFGPETVVSEFRGSDQEWRDQDSPPCFRPQQTLASLDHKGPFHLVVAPL